MQPWFLRQWVKIFFSLFVIFSLLVEFILLDDKQNLGVGVFVRTKYGLFLRCFYTYFMLVMIAFLRFSSDFILFGRFSIIVEKCQNFGRKNGRKCPKLRNGSNWLPPAQKYKRPPQKNNRPNGTKPAQPPPSRAPGVPMCTQFSLRKFSKKSKKILILVLFFGTYVPFQISLNPLCFSC